MKDWELIELKMTCEACPEQYDAYIGEEKVGYLRLRWGYFRAEHMEEVVYQTATMGNSYFETNERAYHLKKARKAIAKAHKKAMRAKGAEGSKDAEGAKDAAWADLRTLVEAEIAYTERQDMVRRFISDNAEKLLPIIKKLAE